MDKSSSAPAPTLSANHGRNERKTDNHTPSHSGQTKSAGGLFLSMALNMSWQLAIVVLVPILVGVKLDKVLSTGFVCTFAGLGVALVGSSFVMWQALRD